jgi:hypothetical protein
LPHRCCDRSAEPVKTEAVERTALLRLPCLSRLSASPSQPWSWPTCGHPEPNDCYTAYHTPAATRLYHAQNNCDLTRLLCWTRKSSCLDSLARCPQYAVSLTRSTQARCAGKHRRKAPITPLRIYDDKTHDFCTCFQEGRWKSAPMGARRRSTTRKMPVRECAAHTDTTM